MPPYRSNRNNCIDGSRRRVYNTTRLTCPDCKGVYRNLSGLSKHRNTFHARPFGHSMTILGRQQPTTQQPQDGSTDVSQCPEPHLDDPSVLPTVHGDPENHLYEIRHKYLDGAQPSASNFSLLTQLYQDDPVISLECFSKIPTYRRLPARLPA
ncbi:hypothetical protein PHLCEN_2v12272 [Hermanssonia centrifuga]|uniref:C2H2-type domain-containing protein n=1 Tax=Hermanssonia centrifuga TaxID=98765 RepID=A0A2R6NHI9_9APHY|nr:hypothetical protein PHLCEN_2v12272 [Hermanssonia centrifuga]